jgi:hypothetical protein
MASGACHCMTPQITFFPYGNFVMTHFSSDNVGFPLVWLQFPAYALVLTLVKGVRWRIGVLLFLMVLHVLAATFGYRDYCDRRSTCSLVVASDSCACLALDSCLFVDSGRQHRAEMTGNG